MTEDRLRIAVQKSGRLSEKSIDLFRKCGITFDLRRDRLLNVSEDFPVDLMLVRDDDIPTYTVDGVCDLGIVGENVLREKFQGLSTTDRTGIETLMPLAFGACRLSLAVPESFSYLSPDSLDGLVIATSYPACLREFLARKGVSATIIELNGSVEIAPALKIADAICDLVSSGSTLRSNGLKEVTRIFESQASLIKTDRQLSPGKRALIERLQQRIKGVLTAARSKYIMMNAPKSSLPEILSILPGLEAPSIIPLGMNSESVAIHAVTSEEIFWDTIEKLKLQGASSILVLPIEKVIS